MPKTKPNKPQISKRRAIDDRATQFKNPLLRVAIAPVAELRKSDPEYMEIDRLDRLKEFEGYYEVISDGQ